MSGKQPWRAEFAQALAALERAAGPRYLSVLRHGSLEVEIYAPRGSDPQSPHDRDELYVVMQGSGQFINGDTRAAFAPGDVLFVPAGAMHRFEAFSDDLAVWVMFYGPVGGEAEEQS